MRTAQSKTGSTLQVTKRQVIKSIKNRLWGQATEQQKRGPEWISVFFFFCLVFLINYHTSDMFCTVPC